MSISKGDRVKFKEETYFPNQIAKGREGEILEVLSTNFVKLKLFDEIYKSVLEDYEHIVHQSDLILVEDSTPKWVRDYIERKKLDGTK